MVAVLAILAVTGRQQIQVHKLDWILIRLKMADLDGYVK